MEKLFYIYIACMLCLVCANICTTNKFSYNKKEMLKENLFIRNIEKEIVIMYYVMKVVTWPRQMDTGGYGNIK